MKAPLSLRDTLAYDPIASRFGTSGVRALVKDLTDLEVYCLTRGTVAYFERIGRMQSGAAPAASVRIPLAGDLRASTERMLGATARAIVDAGYRVDYVGRLPTPALTYYALERGVAGFMVTGSHIPAERNGQKAIRCDGEVRKSDEAGIMAAIEGVRQREYERPAARSKFDPYGMLRSEHRLRLPTVNPMAEALYAQRYAGVFAQRPLQGKRIVFFEHSAVGRDLLPRILEGAGAEVLRAGRSEEFVPIDTEAISTAQMAMLSAIVREQEDKHGRVDALVSTDGDSDRPLIVGVEAPAGPGRRALRFFPGDLVGAIVADYLRADSVSVPISTSPAVDEHFHRQGLPTTKTRIGSPYVLEAMRAALAQGRQRIVAWEANGGFLTGSAMALNQGTLQALPTRDATLPILAVLASAAERGVTLSAIFDELPPWYGKADLLDGFSRETSDKIMAHFRPPRQDAAWLDFVGDNIVLRDTEGSTIGQWWPAEATSQVFLRKKDELEHIFTEERGFAEIERINLQDGIRCLFRNEEIVHIRPSGNAPQLRIYAHARTQTRADEIVALGVAEPDGLLRELQRRIEHIDGGEGR